MNPKKGKVNAIYRETYSNAFFFFSKFIFLVCKHDGVQMSIHTVQVSILFLVLYLKTPQ